MQKPYLGVLRNAEQNCACLRLWWWLAVSWNPAIHERGSNDFISMIYFWLRGPTFLTIIGHDIPGLFGLEQRRKHFGLEILCVLKLSSIEIFLTGFIVPCVFHRAAFSCTESSGVSCQILWLCRILMYWCVGSRRFRRSDPFSDQFADQVLQGQTTTYLDFQ